MSTSIYGTFTIINKLTSRDKVLVLLPAQSDKLLLWFGHYEAMRSFLRKEVGTDKLGY
jgi:hypothetical protein